ncbi:MAG: hypothetical protein ACKO37_08710 [Vampirovibrionales bacterium]
MTPIQRQVSPQTPPKSQAKKAQKKPTDPTKGKKAKSTVPPNPTVVAKKTENFAQKLSALENIAKQGLGNMQKFVQQHIAQAKTHVGKGVVKGSVKTSTKNRPTTGTSTAQVANKPPKQNPIATKNPTIASQNKVQKVTPPRNQPIAKTPLQKQLIKNALADFRKMEAYNLNQWEKRRANETYLTLMTNNLKDGLFHLTRGRMGKGGNAYKEQTQAAYDKKANEFLQTLGKKESLKSLEVTNELKQANKVLNQAKTVGEREKARARVNQAIHQALQVKIKGEGQALKQSQKALQTAQTNIETAQHEHNLGREAWNDGFKYVASATAGASVAMTGGAATPLWASIGGGIFVGGGTRIATEQMDSHKGLTKKEMGKAFMTGGIDGGFGALAAGTNNIYQYAGTNIAWNAASRLNSMVLDKEPQGGRRDALWKEIKMAAPYALSDLVTSPIRNPLTNTLLSNTIGTWAYNEIDTIDRDLPNLGQNYQE